MRVLAIKWRRLGDTALWTAALRALRDHVGDEVAIAYPENYAPLFSADSRFPRQFKLRHSAKAEWDFVRAVRRERYDVVLNFHASSRTARLTRWSGGKRWVVHHHDRGKTSNDVPNAGRPMSAIERDLNVVRALGWNGPSPEPALAIAPEPRAPEAPPLVVLGVSASRPSKLWPLARYAELARGLAKDARVAIVYDNDEVFRRDPQAHALFRREGWLAPTPRLEDLLALLSGATLYIGSDSGVKHLAAALGKRTLTLFGPESIGEWHGYDETRHVALQKPVLCRNNDPSPAQFAWCGVETCPYASHACMNLILPEEVAAAARRLLASAPRPC